MFERQKQLKGRGQYLYGLLLLSLISIICGAFSISGNDDFDFAKKEVLLRKVGHKILLQSGDSTSRVLPIKKVAENEYQIRFENELTFQPDSLINTTRRLLAKDPLSRDYIVNVLNCGNTGVVYGYAISRNEKENIVACLGREQPKACYVINIKFKLNSIYTAKNGYLLGSLPFLAFVGFLFLKSVKPRRALRKGQNNGMISLGSALFDVENKKLLINGIAIDLTGTETRLLQILALSPNETIERSRLQKEIWEDEGVIVGRSLDMFISKLRKKLEIEPRVNIVNIRSKGYKLEISG